MELVHHRKSLWLWFLKSQVLDRIKLMMFIIIFIYLNNYEEWLNAIIY